MLNFSIKQLSTTALTLLCLATLSQATYGMDNKGENVSLKIQTIQKLGKEQFIKFIDQPSFPLKEQPINVSINLLNKALSFKKENEFCSLLNKTLGYVRKFNWNNDLFKNILNNWDKENFTTLITHHSLILNTEFIEFRDLLLKKALFFNDDDLLIKTLHQFNGSDTEAPALQSAFKPWDSQKFLELWKKVGKVEKLQKVLRTAWGFKREVYYYDPNRSLNDFLTNVAPFATTIECRSAKIEAIPGIMKILNDHPHVSGFLLMGGRLRGSMEGFFKAFDENKHVTGLRLSTNSIGVGDCEIIGNYLAKDTKLCRFDLTSNSIGDGGTKFLFEGLKKNSKINTLFLSENEIGNEGAKVIGEYIAGNKNFCKLLFEMNDIDAKGAKFITDSLKDHSTFKMLSFRWNSLGVEGAKEIAELLKNNKVIEKLDMQSTEIGNEGALIIAKALNETFKDGHPSLRKLILLCNAIDTNTQGIIKEMLPTVEVIF